jgi:8-oxo-dGTP pyrophosphatase MutT (NUDIX family)
MSLQNVMDDLNMRFIINCPPEELAQLERVFFQVEQAHWFYDDFYRNTYKHLPRLGFKEFSQAFVKRCPTIKGALGLPDDAAVTKAVHNFEKYKHKVPVCGCILLNADMTQCILVKGWIAGSAWNFPKGKMNADEPSIECAVREVLEETGFDATGHILDGENDYIERADKGHTMRLYIARNVPQNFHFATQTRKEISEIRWFDVAAAERGSLGSNDNMSVTGQRFVGDLLAWIERQRSGAKDSSSSSSSRRARGKKKKETTSKETASDQGADNQGRGKPRRGSNDSITFAGEPDTNGWSVEDMFAVNEAKFGIVNSFNMDEYTVPLPDAATQAKALEEYQKLQGSKGKGVRSRGQTLDRVSPTLQPVHKKGKNSRRHSVGSPSELAPSVANMFALAGAVKATAAVPSTPPLPAPRVPAMTPPLAARPDMPRPRGGSLDLEKLQLPVSEANSVPPTKCAAYVAAPVSFAFNKEDILSCI